MLDLGRAILRLEKARRELLTTDPGDKEKLLAASRKVDRLVVEYYRAKAGRAGTEITNLISPGYGRILAPGKEKVSRKRTLKGERENVNH
ncbi:hypothetical protein [Desulfofundulus sp. TPOSR]|uniref:hypothetical protein n=1 Tax=Desulfofundulus sp. TPOSR TaxID=2714340 RepID=UPI001FAD51EA|nr:hypothetical protein [Desulfofundulus sp. TPOSR]